ncbi:MAG: beta-phosphoglucomutase family hydrolase [Chloroherpetonaceae bacterium]|nr:beta-phosphoglucomutase family hydrolase [Chloroherpetonaceae bacterium]
MSRVRTNSLSSEISAFIFDMDGVIADNMKIHTKAWLALFADQGYEMDVREFLEKTSGMKAADVVRFFLGKNISSETVTSLIDQKEFYYRTIYRPKLKAAKGLRKFLDDARKAKILMGVATGGSRKNADFVLSGLEIKSYFRSILTADDVKKGKPNPEIYLSSAKNLGVQPENCLVFEDAMPGIASAEAAGMKVIAVTTSHSKKEFSKEISKLSPIVGFIYNFSELKIKDLRS